MNPPTTALSVSSTMKYVLIVDEEPIIRSVLTSLLSSWGYTTHTAGNLIGACRMVVSDGPFDAIVCNYEFPDGNAFNLVDWMHEQQLEVPAVVLFGVPRPLTKPPNNVTMLPKPLDPAELKEAFERVSSNGAARRGRAAARRKSLSHARR